MKQLLDAEMPHLPQITSLFAGICMILRATEHLFSYSFSSFGAEGVQKASGIMF